MSSDAAAVGPRAPSGVELGVVEGFYGLPWSHDARRRMCRFAAAKGVGTFIWAPKNDPAHRSAWEERPTLQHVAAVAELAADAARTGVRWVYGISPVIQRGRTSRDAVAILARLAPIRKAGVREFLIAFDDTWPTFLPRLAGHALGRAHGDVARAIADDLQGRDGGCEVLIVPAVYFGRAEELPPGALAYLRGLGESARGLRVAWTGPRIFSPWISRADVVSLEAKTDLCLWIWSNAVANDWLPLVTGAGFGLRGMERLSGGPLANLDAELAEPGRLVVVNGAREAALTLPHVASLATWAADPRAYDASLALRRGLEQAFGARAAQSLGVLFDASTRHALAAPSRLDLAALDAAVAALAAASRDRAAVLSAAAPGAADDVGRELSLLETLPAALAAAIDDEATRFEVFAPARKLALLASAARLALGLVTSGPIDAATKRARRAQMRELLREADRVRWDVGEAPLRRLVALAERA